MLLRARPSLAQGTEGAVPKGDAGRKVVNLLDDGTGQEKLTKLSQVDALVWSFLQSSVIQIETVYIHVDDCHASPFGILSSSWVRMCTLLKPPCFLEGQEAKPIRKVRLQCLVPAITTVPGRG